MSTSWTSFRLAITSPAARRAWKALLWVGVAVTLFMALVPAPPKALTTGWDKSDHLGAFACLTVAGRLAWGGQVRRQVMLALALVGFGGMIEVLQMWVPQRQADWHDLLADTLGVVMGLMVCAMSSRLTRHSRNRSRSTDL